ncbi:hypothetical protein FQA39_LY08309 [Lamprigera yunnana]|nr:hypothetical protein FQA39_LY08309 [Lamprigera yunnana]
MQGGADPSEDYATTRHTVPPFIAIIFIILLFTLYGMVYLAEGVLPTALNIIDEKQHLDAFIAERAQQDLQEYTEIGPRIVGSYENEVVAVDFLQQKIASIQQSANAIHKIDVNVQLVSGSFLVDRGHVFAYDKVQNVVAKLHSSNNSHNSLLINAHFDSIQGSPGSHGFITQHKWAKEVRAFINLEAIGVGGKEMLFQVGPHQPWLLSYYQKVPHPCGSASIEEMFQHGYMALDTDFQMIKDYGNTVGMELMFYRNGYKYHTRFDDISNVPLGSIQHIGDNLLKLVRELGNAPEISNPWMQTSGKIIYFDVMELFMIYYTETIAVIINISVSVLSVVVALRNFHSFGLRFCRQSLIYLGLMSAAIVTGWLTAVIFITFIALIIDGLQYNLSWYNNRLIIFGLYVIPINICIYGITLTFNYFNDKNKFNISARAQIQLHLLRLIWTLVLLVGTLAGFRFVYVVFVPVFFQTLTFAFIEMIAIQRTIRKWQIVYILGMILPSIFLMQHALQIVLIMIPVYGRIGSDKNSEIYLGMLIVTLTILTISHYMPLITLVRKPSALMMTLTLIFIIYGIILFTPFGFPYAGNPEAPAPQRYYIYHTQRIFRNDTNDIYKRDAGLFVLNFDRNSPDNLKKYVTELSDVKSISGDCDHSLFCGLPLVNTKTIPILRRSTWIPIEEPKIPEPISLQLISKTHISEYIARYNFTLSGPNHVAVYLSPKANINILEISLLSKSQLEPIIWNGRPTYIIMYSWMKSRSSLNFYIDFQTPLNWTNPTFDVALTAKYINDKTFTKTPKFSQFLVEFPKWTDVVVALATFEQWVY